ncbi:MAG: hypothetical protein LBK26_00790 [Rickettsiales bacterium]|jgi:hypothetical protein|nr:hypothetical protein [Rickettsiales bacterium]
MSKNAKHIHEYKREKILKRAIQEVKKTKLQPQDILILTDAQFTKVKAIQKIHTPNMKNEEGRHMARQNFRRNTRQIDKLYFGGGYNCINQKEK